MDWPKLKRDYIGLRVAVTTPIKNKCYSFRRGVKMTVVGYYRGLKLKDRRGRWITRVQTRYVKLIK